mmetsp:Transcript_8684/g.15729  ORF Transcript_8684/g.15729 Transcript_8684/m.15729 type:complete len:240 (+) Transcript_8684:567-1286(+)
MANANTSTNDKIGTTVFSAKFTLCTVFHAQSPKMRLLSASFHVTSFSLRTVSSANASTNDKIGASFEGANLLSSVLVTHPPLPCIGGTSFVVASFRLFRSVFPCSMFPTHSSLHRITFTSFAAALITDFHLRPVAFANTTLLGIVGAPFETANFAMAAVPIANSRRLRFISASFNAASFFRCPMANANATFSGKVSASLTAANFTDSPPLPHFPLFYVVFFYFALFCFFNSIVFVPLFR